MPSVYLTKIRQILGSQAEELLNLQTSQKKFPKDKLTIPQPNFVDKVYALSDRNNQTLRNLQNLFGHGRLANTGYLSIFPVDQGVEHSAGSAFAHNPEFFDPEVIIQMAIQGGCNAVVSTLGVLALYSRKYAHHIPFVVKLNHRESLSYPSRQEEIMFASVRQAWHLGAIGVGATIHFGSENSHQELEQVRLAFEEAHSLGMFTILWCYLRNEYFLQNGVNYQSAADLTGQACYLGVSLGADIIKQKPPKNNGGFQALNQLNQTRQIADNYGQLNPKLYELTGQQELDWTRYQVANCYMGKIPLINSGNASGDDDLLEAVKSAIINKKAGGAGLILGRKAFQQETFAKGLEILQAVQEVYLCPEIEVV